MARPRYTYNYDHDTDTTTIISVEKISGKIVTTTKTVEGNQIPKKKMSRLFLLPLGILPIVAITQPFLVIGPASVFLAHKLTINKKPKERTIACFGALLASSIMCSTFIKPYVGSSSSSSGMSSRDRARAKLQETYGNCAEDPDGVFRCIDR